MSPFGTSFAGKDDHTPFATLDTESTARLLPVTPWDLSGLYRCSANASEHIPQLASAALFARTARFLTRAWRSRFWGRNTGHGTGSGGGSSKQFTKKMSPMLPSYGQVRRCKENDCPTARPREGGAALRYISAYKLGSLILTLRMHAVWLRSYGVERCISSNLTVNYPDRELAPVSCQVSTPTLCRLTHRSMAKVGICIQSRRTTWVGGTPKYPGWHEGLECLAWRPVTASVTTAETGLKLPSQPPL